MKLAALVALGLSAIVLGFASAELAKILGSLWNDIFEQLHLDSAQLLAWVLMSVILLRAWGACSWTRARRANWWRHTS